MGDISKLSKGAWSAMTFQQLEYVVEISKCGSINKAAQKLFLSQSGISTAVRELEGEQMTALFNFAEEDRTAWIEEEGEYMDLYTGKKVSLQAIKMEGHSFVLAKKC